MSVLQEVPANGTNNPNTRSQTLTLPATPQPTFSATRAPPSLLFSADPEPLDQLSLHQLPAQSPTTEYQATPRLFGLRRSTLERAIQPLNYEQRHAGDRFGEETGESARVWETYLREAYTSDRDMVEGWRDGIDVMLVFAGLFSAVVTSFVVQTYQKLDVEWDRFSASLLVNLTHIQRALANGTSIDGIIPSEPKPEYTTTDVWVNALFFTSLAFGLVAALAAVLIKQWIQHYVSVISGTPRSRAHLRHFRYAGMKEWFVPTIISVLPLLLHIALLLFFGGIVVLLVPLHKAIASIFAIVGGLGFIAYVIANLLPLRYPQCPYRTPVVAHLRPVIALFAKFLYKTLRFDRSRTPSFPDYFDMTMNEVEQRAAANLNKNLDAQSILWLLSSSSDPSVRSIALQAFCGLDHSQKKETKAVFDLPNLKEELQSAIEARTLLAVRNFGKDPDPQRFMESSLFYDIERLLRVAMLFSVKLAFGSHRFAKLAVATLKTNVEMVDRRRLLAYTTYVVQRGAYPDSVSPAVETNIRLSWIEAEDPKDDALTSKQSLEPQDMHAIWNQFYRSLALSRHVSTIMSPNVTGGFVGTCDYLLHLLDLVPPRLPPRPSSQEDLALEAICQFLSRIFNTPSSITPSLLIEQFSAVKDIPDEDPLKLWLLLLLGVSEIEDVDLDTIEPILTLTLTKLTSRLSNTDQEMLRLDLESYNGVVPRVVNRFISQSPFLGPNHSYTLDIDASVSKLYILVNQLQANAQHNLQQTLPSLLSNLNRETFATAFFGFFLDLPQIDGNYLSGLVSEITHYLEVHQTDDDTLSSIIASLAAVDWFKAVTEIRERPVVLLAYTVIDWISTTRDSVLFLNHVASRSEVLQWLFSAFIIGDHRSGVLARITFVSDHEADILLDLARRTSSFDAWHDALNKQVELCHKLNQIAVWYPDWRDRNQEQYIKMADFLGALSDILGIQPTELQIPRLGQAEDSSQRVDTAQQDLFEPDPQYNPLLAMRGNLRRLIPFLLSNQHSSDDPLTMGTV